MQNFIRYLSLTLAVTLATNLPLQAKAEDEARKVLVAKVEEKSFQAQIPIFGNLVPFKESQLSVKVSGYVEKMHVDIGDTVNKGQRLLTLDAVQAKTSLEQLKASLQEAKVRLDEANRLATEGEKLRKDHNISNSEYLTRITEQQAARSQVKQIEAQLNLANEELSRHTLKAPFAGVITAKLTEVGESVGNDTPVFILTKLDPIYVQIQVPIRHYGDINNQTQVLVDSSNNSQGAITTKVDRIVPQADAALRSFLVRLRLDNKDGRWLPGMNVRSRFLIEQNQGQASLFLPKDALVRKIDGSVKVFKIVNAGQGTQAKSVSVVTGAQQGQGIAVTSSSLKVGDQVVIYGNESLRDGDAVIPELTKTAMTKDQK
ncbi:efflux RND transporter periplasmic adaptor subunit [Thalassotalea sp. PS06]|uniref:efflux RND transporter periplasmic adaptor subunit n=1 Tax=Thalassotalea sp. PS06 TaxID=2594005 RepID=UPI001162C05E|nr:efflux RND transporter periplasmic adaptor subunit [Thalassotalea sp. PS06]QDP02402.1 efflux RND transporter periplasmic adaptor subunit [Thalassotalea sp. PS06]